MTKFILWRLFLYLAFCALMAYLLIKGGTDAVEALTFSLFTIGVVMILGTGIELLSVYNTSRVLETSFWNVFTARYEFGWSTDWINQNQETFLQEFEAEKRKRGMG